MQVVQATNPTRALVLTKALINVAARLELSTVELNRIVGISQSSASRLLSGSYVLKEKSKEWELAALLIRLYRGLHSIVGNDDGLARTWLKSPNRAFGDQLPGQVIAQASGLVFACDYVDAHRAAS